MRAVPDSAFLALVLVLSMSAPVLAAEPAASQAPVGDPAETAANEAVAQVVSWGEALSADELGAQRGGEETVNSVIRVSGEVTDNSADHVITGANSIGGGSFANASGISTVIQNTGANVLIQSATIVNVQFSDP
ncbi:MAG TPA: hypothetical protein VNQ81_09800 [Povalibacter sp.]|nr:hypothetical protein [Povalibacter sp.]